MAAIAAASYGTNPVFALPLYQEGMSANSVLLFRYLLGLPLLAAMMAWRGRSLRISRREVAPLATVGVMVALSSLALFESYNMMNAGVASTLLFVYPVLVAVLMIFFFHERFRVSTLLCLALMGTGLVLLMRGGSGASLSVLGCVLVMVSALTYAIYLVMVNVSAVLHSVPTLKLSFYVLLFGSGVFAFMMLLGNELTVPQTASGWCCVVALAVVPTILSFTCTNVAVQLIGSTPTAIFGALEPLTAVVLSVAVLHQSITGRELVGGAFILLATSLVIAADPVEDVLLRVRRMFPSLRRK